MNLFFLRHAKACPRGPKFRPDSKRPLTREGEKTMREAAAGIQKLDLSFDLILTSPYARALRTAEILAEAYDSKKLFVTNHLAAEAEPAEVVDRNCRELFHPGKHRVGRARAVFERIDFHPAHRQAGNED